MNVSLLRFVQLRKILAFSVFACILTLFYSAFVFPRSQSSNSKVQKLTEVYVDARSESSDADGSATNPFRSIGEGVDAAAQNAKVIVAPGRYIETLYIFTAVHFEGNGMPILEAKDNSGALITFYASGTFDGFRLQYGANRNTSIDPPSGILIRDPAGVVKIANNSIENFMTAVEISTRGSVVVDNNKISNNYYGISTINNPGKLQLISNSIEENVTGVFCSESDLYAAENVIRRNRIGLKLATRDNDYPSYRVVLENNTVTENLLYGAWVHQGTETMKASLDLGGGGFSKGGNTIGMNQGHDLYNDSDGTIYARKNIWLSRNISARNPKTIIEGTESKE